MACDMYRGVNFLHLLRLMVESPLSPKPVADTACPRAQYKPNASHQAPLHCWLTVESFVFSA